MPSTLDLYAILAALVPPASLLLLWFVGMLGRDERDEQDERDDLDAHDTPTCGASVQEFRLDGTFTDSSNYERLAVGEDRIEARDETQP